MASLSFEIEKQTDSIELKWKGYNDSMATFIEGMLGQIKELQSSSSIESLFMQSKEKLLQKYVNFY